MPIYSRRSRNPYKRSVNRAIYGNYRRTRKYGYPIMKQIAWDTVKAVTNVEVKYLDTNFDLDASPEESIMLNKIAEGYGASQHVGRQCKNTKLHIRGIITSHDATLAEPHAVRVMVVRTLFNTDNTFDIDNLMQNAFDDTVPNLYGFYDLDTKADYQVLYDKMFVMSSSDGSNFEAKNVIINLDLTKNRNKGMVQKFSGATASEADCSYGGIFLVCAAANTASTVTNGDIDFVGTSRIRFLDN